MRTQLLQVVNIINKSQYQNHMCYYYHKSIEGNAGCLFVVFVVMFVTLDACVASGLAVSSLAPQSGEA